MGTRILSSPGYNVSGSGAPFIRTVILPAGGVSTYPYYATIDDDNAITNRTNPIAGSVTIYDVASNGTTFVVITSGGGYKSSDGINWASISSMGAANGTFRKIRASTSTGYFCAIDNTNKVTVSTDGGDSWAQATLSDHADGALTNGEIGLNANVFAITRNRSGVGSYVHITSGGGTSFATPDKLSTSDVYASRPLYYLNGKIVISAHPTLFSGWYLDGSSWTSFSGTGSLPNAGVSPNIVWNGTKTIGTYSSAGPVRRISANTDASAPPTSSWSVISTDQGNIYAPCWWAGSRFYACSYFSTRGDSQIWCVYSTDGITWNSHAGPTADHIGYCGASNNAITY